MDYFLNPNTHSRQLGEDFLLFSELSKETLLVHPFTAKLFKLLTMDKGINQHFIERQLMNQYPQITTEFIDNSLKQLVNLGFIHCHS